MGFSHALPRSVSLSFLSRNSKGIANEYCIATWSDSQKTIPPIKGLTLGFATGTARVGTEPKGPPRSEAGFLVSYFHRGELPLRFQGRGLRSSRSPLTDSEIVMSSVDFRTGQLRDLCARCLPPIMREWVSLSTGGVPMASGRPERGTPHRVW